MIIAGAGGHGLEVFQCLLDQGVSESQLFFFDEDVSKVDNHPLSQKVFHSLSDISEVFRDQPEFCLGVGNPIFRQRLVEILCNVGGQFVGLSHPSAISASNLAGSVFDKMAFSYLGPQVRLGNGVLINVRASVHHESTIGNFVEIGPGALLLGGTTVGDRCRIGAGAILLPGVKLGNDVIVGAGAVVTKDFANNSLVKGIPASDFR